tara:strand:+ start:89205 stop:89798 length:594 start_codon:yes stop_codon:yes gene_type:complete
VNHLAHARLSSADPLHRVGNVTGDFIKGPLAPQGLSTKLREGVQHHRLIDRYTDDHAVTRELRELFAPPFRRYATILLDVAFDYFLIQHWQRFAAVPRAAFVASVYDLLIAHRHELPAPLAEVTPRLVAHDWLSRCDSPEGVESTLRGLSGRLQRSNPLADGATEIDRHAAQIEAGFLAFFPQALAFSDALAVPPQD